VILYMIPAGFLAYLLFLKRALQELNPDAVIPERVSAALDTLAEGLLIIDTNGYIVFSNDSFAKKTGLNKASLLGKSSSDLDWTVSAGVYNNIRLPWLSVLEGQTLPEGITVKLQTSRKEMLTFAINASPVLASENKIRGVLVTFDDITDMERKNEELEQTNSKLQKIQQEISRQNEELHFLATRDPLTNTLNRRSLFQGFDLLFAEAKASEGELCCIMVDIDHFKRVNDDFGHATGDKVIKMLGKVLLSHSRTNDLVGRYGGEEFCIVMPNTDIVIATAIAERIRVAVSELDNLDENNTLKITSSFGVSFIANGACDPSALVDEADKALYHSKQNGRDQVAVWPCDENTISILDAAMKMAESQLVDSSSAPDTSDQSASASTQRSTENRNKARARKNYAEQHEGISEIGSSLPQNRALIVDRIDQALKHGERQKKQVAVMAMNIGSLQKVNDTLGYRVSEKFIGAVVERLQDTLRDTDTIVVAKQENELLFNIARVNNDELIIVLNDLEKSEIISNILHRIFSVFEAPIEAECMEFFLDVHIGISVAPEDGNTPNDLIAHASSAMREALKDSHTSNFKFYDVDINERLIKQMHMESELHRAIERNELVLYYQPKVDIKNGNIAGMEALIRWMHPKLGMVMPDEFIPIAEQSGIIEDIGRWVLKTACLQTKCWQEMGYKNLSIAVNISPVEFRNRHLAKDILQIVAECEIPNNAVELEITETAMIQNVDLASDIIEHLADAGMAITMDDFGVGYSSLRYLQQFPLQRVKIDRSFIASFLENANDAAIVSAIVAMSHSLGLSIVAEGVESTEHLRFLQDLSCDQIQGYLISKPMRHEDVPEFLEGEAQIRHLIVDDRQDRNLLTLHQSNNMIGVLNELPLASGQ
ncbi:MAG: EAL domain-containing protein, partial [Pseudomonadales bacterium]